MTEVNKTFFKINYVFQDESFYTFSGSTTKVEGPYSISLSLRGLPNSIDSAFVWSGNGRIYFTKGTPTYIS